jgi:hypothetical protein
MPETMPQNAPYMVAAYIVTAVILVGYAIALARRSRRRRDS